MGEKWPKKSGGTVEKRREQRVFEVAIAGVGTDALLAVQLVLEQIAVRVCEDRVALPATKPAPC